MVTDEEKWYLHFDSHRARLGDMFNLDLQDIGLESWDNLYEELWGLFNSKRAWPPYTSELATFLHFENHLLKAGESKSKESFMRYIAERYPLQDELAARYVPDLNTIFHPPKETEVLNLVDIFQVHELAHAVIWRLVDCPTIYFQNYGACYEGDASKLEAANAETRLWGMMNEGFCEYISLNLFACSYELPDMQVWLDARKTRHLKVLGVPIDTTHYAKATGYDYQELMSRLVEGNPLNHEYGYLYYVLNSKRGRSIEDIVMHPPESVEAVMNQVHEAIEAEGFDAFLVGDGPISTE